MPGRATHVLRQRTCPPGIAPRGREPDVGPHAPARMATCDRSPAIPRHLTMTARVDVRKGSHGALTNALARSVGGLTCVGTACRRQTNAIPARACVLQRPHAVRPQQPPLPPTAPRARADPGGPRARSAPSVDLGRFTRRYRAGWVSCRSARSRTKVAIVESKAKFADIRLPRPQVNGAGPAGRQRSHAGQGAEPLPALSFCLVRRSC